MNRRDARRTGLEPQAPPCARAWGWVVALALVSIPLGGCLGKPEIQDRWTRVDVESSNVTPNQMFAPGSLAPVTVRAAITYRAIVTGFCVVELRSSGALSAADVVIKPDAEREPMAADIDRILLNSVSMGRATRAVTGWDHLIQPIDFAFDAHIPAASDSSGAPTGLFLVCYLGSGQRMERQDGTDSLIVTPFNSTQYEILPVGMELRVGTP